MQNKATQQQYKVLALTAALCALRLGLSGLKLNRFSFYLRYSEYCNRLLSALLWPRGLRNVLAFLLRKASLSNETKLFTIAQLLLEVKFQKN